MYAHTQQKLSEQDVPASAAPKTLSELYHEMFEIVIADTDALIDECYRLRYQVFCVEHELFETADPEYERDEFDGRALHALLRHRKSGEFIGTTRLILHDDDAPKPLPFFQLCDENHIPVPDPIRRKISFEISRFCIAKSFRRRVTDGLLPSAYSPREMAEVRGRVIPFMALGLIKAIMDWNKQYNFELGCAAMEPALIRLLETLGFHFNRIGHPVDYHGTRHLLYDNFTKVLGTLKQERPDIYALMMS